MQVLQVDNKYLSVGGKLLNASGDNKVVTASRKIVISGHKAVLMPRPVTYITFASPSDFTLTGGYCDGWLYFSTDGETWKTYDSSSTIHSVNGKLYMRGKGNTLVSRLGLNSRFIITGTDVSCIGNIENLLDYTIVANGEHPTMASNCFNGLFYNCTALISAPELPARTIPISATSCYQSMFGGCTALTAAPSLPATELSSNCYASMFRNCTALTKIPVLPATSLKGWCYNAMFYGCTSLKFSTTQTDECSNPYRIPKDGIGTVDGYSLDGMFGGISGTFTGTPSINTTYYTNAEVVE